ncbi:SIR2 family NAD-dependent protein deacylase [Stratiformator vulcanicus]|uniref:NAD-dependent protein deacylase n=1 Tax=Stratiformator vulcanicus TaxID=2527980 RepID=A0A517R4Z7_9PLAN|nr:NAD-dependent deacylase [Stratiformator vulcanicus]QDT38893.1 NAD-dependent protein deacylase [Stratiformator vulcanicus]
MSIYKRISSRISSAGFVAILTGAGVSAPSGVPTFRDPGGLWRNYRPEDLATPEAFARDPKLVWEWYELRRAGIAKCLPNAAHRVIAEWQRTRPNVTLITQNVDGLHEAAGSDDIVRLHGSLWLIRCSTGCSAERWDRTVPLPELPPRCANCGAFERPGVVWFGERLNEESLHRAATACEADVFLSIGTSSLVSPAAYLLPRAKELGAYTIEINPEATGHKSTVDLAMPESADTALSAINDLL